MGALRCAAARNNAGIQGAAMFITGAWKIFRGGSGGNHVGQARLAIPKGAAVWHLRCWRRRFGLACCYSTPARVRELQQSRNARQITTGKSVAARMEQSLQGGTLIVWRRAFRSCLRSLNSQPCGTGGPTWATFSAISSLGSSGLQAAVALHSRRRDTIAGATALLCFGGLTGFLFVRVTCYCAQCLMGGVPGL